MAEVRNSNKARQLVQIRLHRKKVQSDRLFEEIEIRSAALTEKRKLLDEARAELNAKQQSLSEQLARMDAKMTSSDVKEAERAATVLKADTHTVREKVDQYSDEVKKLVEDFKPTRERQEELSDETAAENVNLETDHQVLDEQLVMMKWWLLVMGVSILVGVVTIFVGFRLWYVRIQVHQDAILREQAESKSGSRTPGG